MARRVLRAGHDLTVWNRTTEKARALENEGAKIAASPSGVATGADAVITMLADGAALEQVVFGDDGIAEALAPETFLVEMSTVGPAVIKGVRDRLHDTVVIDAPVLGSVPQATDGELKIFVGADEPTFGRVEPLLKTMGDPQRVGGPGAGAAMKIVVNSTLGAAMTALGEALSLAASLGLDQETALDVLAGSPLGATVARKRDNIAEVDYPANFKLALARKDLELVTQTGRDHHAELLVAAAAKAWFERAAEGGLGELDYSAVIAWITGDEGVVGKPER
ncbi:MAG: NAD(P)-dependent oxidoreductase [Actinomycetota bacterium]|nr:NAD(P)-dependent oxidoreductase [Actinomycetota bacterium]